ncbi:TIGR03364 family FAD-dependent oxidoreductase [Blastopirellula sp. JC732]|uniref:TIGR03364 family FAD-dependent oxidoreductase n=1 Tax=Blastopirellula sediminis TaxID=2894196 RepID=A0A9X1MK11_9BACT|nr:TIGR03364 family FAD-dependent oxidoreductase [Blastopirellula sediminis]MCC9607885.1 TIGR03364 family FAD-dependent oxidoreductase [Blastopirellula sediminis]MCC9627322.1 TIGR03364 family FAD-dependent oxidoreductase [Blastopirellula sediminis]
MKNSGGERYDMAVVGAGIVGLAHAWRAAQRGLRVLVLDRRPYGSGASIRNFGMIWPVGQTQAGLWSTAMKSRGLWLELAQKAGIPIHTCGSLHLAFRDDEWAVLEEFQAKQGAQYGTELISADDVHQKTPAAKPEGLIGALWSNTEMRVNPRVAVAAIPSFLIDQFDVKFEFSTTVIRVGDGEVEAADGRRWLADHTIICSGADFANLFPQTHEEAGLYNCKLQMLRTAPLGDFKIGPHLAGGLTLRHYEAFRSCDSLAALNERVSRETPELDQYGIHVMASQTDEGEVVLGDSHQYGDEIEPFDLAEIEGLMLRELHKIIRLPDWTVQQRWHGYYAKSAKKSIVFEQPKPGVTIVNGVGGAGMTLSMGVGEEVISRLIGEQAIGANAGEAVHVG